MLLLSLNFELLAQDMMIESHCDGKLVYFSDNGINTDTTYSVFLQTYFNEFHPQQKPFLTADVSLLDEFTTLISNKNAYVGEFRNAHFIDVEITLRALNETEEHFVQNQMSLLDLFDAPDSVIKAYKRIYGYTKTENNTRIDKIKINVNGKDLIVPDSILDYFYSPNICNKYGSIKPLKTFYSNKNNCIYIYVCGDIPFELMPRA